MIFSKSVKVQIPIKFYKSTKNPAASSRLPFSTISRRIDFFARRISDTKKPQKTSSLKQGPKKPPKIQGAQAGSCFLMIFLIFYKFSKLLILSANCKSI